MQNKVANEIHAAFLNEYSMYVKTLHRCPEITRKVWLWRAMFYTKHDFEICTCVINLFTSTRPWLSTLSRVCWPHRTTQRDVSCLQAVKTVRLFFQWDNFVIVLLPILVVRQKKKCFHKSSRIFTTVNLIMMWDMWLTFSGGVMHLVQRDRYLASHASHYLRSIRVVTYSQFLESYQSVQMSTMAEKFGVSEEFIDGYAPRKWA